MKLKSKSISLRDWKSKDFDRFRFWNKGEHLWMDYNGPYYAKKNSEEIEEGIKLYQEKIETGQWDRPRKRLVITDNKYDQILGTVSWYWQSIETNWKSIGLAIYDDKNWGKGIGYEALVLWVQYLFDEDERLVRLDLRTWSGNMGMIKLARKLGFKEEACFRKARIVKGEYYDSIGMGILREEWNGKNKN